jgi:hypothetical protein
LKAVLLEAAPIYRRLWWKRHDAQNRQWIAQLQPLLGKYGDSLRDSLIEIYPDRSLIERDWKPHMNGAVDLQQAVSKLVEDLATIQR